MIRKVLTYLSTILVVFAFNSNSVAQQYKTVVQSVEASKVKLLTFDFYVYAGGSSNNLGKLWTATNGNRFFNDMYSTSVNGGLGTEVCYRMLRSSLTLGYKYERIAQDRWFSESDGVYSNWLSVDWNVSYAFGMLGLCTDVYLNGYTKSSDNFKYVGFNKNCFNKASLCLYGGMVLRFHAFRLEARLGIYTQPHLDVNKVAYYNAGKTQLKKGYFEIRIAYRLFTTGNVFGINEKGL